MSTVTEETAYVGPEEIMKDWDVSRATAYSIIRKMNEQMHKAHPNALIIAGKINRVWYENSCLIPQRKKEGAI